MALALSYYLPLILTSKENKNADSRFKKNQK